jgi:cysteine synthase A
MTHTSLPTSVHATVTAADAPSGVVRLLRLPLGGRTLRLRLYLEGENLYGSVKARTAHALLASLEEAGTLRPGGHVVESTSGNLGIALAGLCAERGYRCTLVVDDATASFSLRRMADLGADLIHVPTPDTAHAVSARIQTVREFLAAHPEAVWTDQYNNPAGPAVHARTTGPALLHHARLPHPDAVTMPVSTGGTLAGAATYIRRHAPAVEIWAVDAVGSAATGHHGAAPRPHKLPGFGSGLRSTFLTSRHCDHTAYVSDTDAALACRIIQHRTGVFVGGSAGAAVLAALAAARRSPGLTDVACLCPDGGDRYQDSIYAPGPRLPAPRQLINSPDLAALHRLFPENGHA